MVDDDLIDELAARRRASGGARETERKRSERSAARRRRGWDEKTYLDRYKALGPAPTNVAEVHGWLLKVHALAVEECVSDPGLQPERRREQIGRLSVQLTKVADLAKMSERLSAYERELEQLKRSRAAEVDPGTPGPAGPRAPQS
jgi:hypothetical protein